MIKIITNHSNTWLKQMVLFSTRVSKNQGVNSHTKEMHPKLSLLVSRVAICIMLIIGCVNTSYSQAIPDSDGDGILNNVDLDNDNDGILDTTECNSTNRISNGTFPTSGGNTNTLTGWTVGGTYASGPPWNSSNGRINLNSDGLEFRRDAGTSTTISQNLTGVTLGATLNLNNIYWRKTFPTTNIAFVLTISYAGTVYATINSTNGNTPTITASNGASVNITGLSTLTATPTINNGIASAKSNLVITLPYSALPSSGSLLLTFTAGSDATEVRDLGMSSISLNSCVDTDGDGIPDYLDLDSDNDGCVDALEGGENVTNVQLVNAASGLSVGFGSLVANQNIGGAVDANGVPLLVNTGGAADTGTATAGSVGQPIGSSVNSSVNSCCTNPPNTNPATDFTKTGISTFEGFANAWPNNVPNGFIAIESENKGFVITRVSSTNAITNPVEGMLVYDLSNLPTPCVKLFNGAYWKCLEKDCGIPTN